MKNYRDVVVELVVFEGSDIEKSVSNRICMTWNKKFSLKKISNEITKLLEKHDFGDV